MMDLAGLGNFKTIAAKADSSDKLKSKLANRVSASDNHHSNASSNFQDILRADSKADDRKHNSNYRKSISSSSSELPNKKIDNEISQSPENPVAHNSREASDKEYVATQKINEKSNDVSEPEKEDKDATRQDAMKVFLDRMQNELGIKPELVVEAFSKLSPTDLVSPPEESAEKVIAQLSLNKADSKKALSLYNEMLAMTAAAGMSQYLNQNNQQAQIHVMSEKELQQQNLKKSLADMNDRFFITGTHALPKAGAAQQAQMNRAYASQIPSAQNSAISSSTENENNKDQFDISSLTAADIDSLSPEEKDLLNSLSGKAELGQNATSAMNSQAIDEKNIKNADAKMQVAAGTETHNLFAPGTASAPSNADVAKMYNLAQAEAKMAPYMANQAAPVVNSPATKIASEDAALSAKDIAGAPGAQATLNMQTHTAKSGAAGEDKDSSKNDQNTADAEALNSFAKQNNKVLDQKGFTIEAPKPSSADVQTNVKEIISQAQFLVKKGGGEMKVALTPEGLGEVNLKVKMVGSQVNVEMVASNDQTKKLLEKGLGELKDSLAVHKLHLDSIRIDQAKDSSNHFDQQQKSAEQGFQQRFLNDFQDRNQSFRRDMFDIGSARMPSSQTRDIADNDRYASKSKKRTDSSRRLDLVA